MSAFASPAGTDAFPTLGPSTLGPAATLGPPRRGSLMQAPLVYPQFQQQLPQQTQQHRRSLTAATPQGVMLSLGASTGGPPMGSQMGATVAGSMGATLGAPMGAPMGASMGGPMGASMGVDGEAGALGSAAQADERQVEGDAASNQFAHAAVRLLWGALWEDEQQLQLDSPGRAPFIGCGPWGPQLGLSSQKATYEENGNAFDLSGPGEWLPLPECFTRLLCSCNNRGSCSCSALPPHGFIPELNRLWVAQDSELWLWEVGASEDAVERLTLPSAVESVTYTPLSRQLLPPALRSWYFWDESKLCTASVVAHLDASGCTDSPPYSDVSSSPLHCLVVSVSSCVCLFAMACRTGDAGGSGFEQQQSTKTFRRSPPVQSVDYKCIGAAPKPRGGPLGAPIELDQVAAHRGSSLVVFGSSGSQQVYLLDVKPLEGASLGFPQLFKRARGMQSENASAEAAASDADAAALRAVLPPTESSTGFGFKGWGAREDSDNSGLLACRLVPLNPKLSDWLRWGFSLLSSSLGFGGSAANKSIFASRGQEEAKRREGFVQLEVDEPRGIVWALGGDSSVSAFIMPLPTADEPLPAQDAVKNIKTLRLSCKEIEEGLRRVSADWRRSPSGRGRLLGPLLRSGRFRAVSLSVTAPHEGHSVVAILVDAVGGRTYISLIGYRGLCSSLSLSFPLPASLALGGYPGGPMRLEVRGYRGPIDPLSTSLGPLRCTSVHCGVFVSAYASPMEESTNAAAASKGNLSDGLSLRRCAACRSSCALGAPCAVNGAHADGEGLAGTLVEGGRGGDSAVIHDESNSCCSSAGSPVCCCCNSRTVAATDPVERVGDASVSCSSDILVAAAPDLRALALLQTRSSDTVAAAAVPGPALTTAAAPAQGAPGFGGYFPPLKSQTVAGDTGASAQAGRSNSASPSVCNEWFVPLRLKENAGRVLLVSEALPSPSFGVLQQSSTICPSAFDRRKRRQWASLPYRADPFLSFRFDRNLGMGLRSSLSTKKQDSIYASLPSTYPPSALSDSSAGALCGAPKLLIITNRYVLHLRRQGIAQIYSKAIESLSRDGVQGPVAPTLPHAAFSSDQQGNFEPDQQQQQQQQQQRSSVLGVGPQRYAQWRHACLVAEQMCEESNFGAGAMFSVFWQLMVDSTYSLSAFPFTQSPGGGHQQGGSEGGAPSTNLLDKQLGALTSGRGPYFQPPGPPHLTQGASVMGGFGFFETPFGLGYLEESGRQQQQQNSFGRGGGGLGSTLGAPQSGGGAAAAKEGDGRATALAVAWRMLAGLEARKEELFVSSDLVREQLTLPVLLQQPLQQLPQQQRQVHQLQQQTWDNGLFKLQQQQQQGSQLVGGLSHDSGFASAPGGLSADVHGDTFQGLPAGISNTTRGLVLFASRLLRPLLGTPLVEAALLPCGLARDSQEEQQQVQQRGQEEQVGGSRKRARDFDLRQEAEGGEYASAQGLPACLVGRFSQPAVTKLLMKLACLYEVVDAVYTTLFYAFGQRASLQQQQQQLSRGPPWGLPLRGAPPHFAALRMAHNNDQVDGSGFMQPAATELQQQEVIWSSISLADAIELSILYGVSKVLISAHEMLTAYQLLMQQASYSVQLGSSRFVAPAVFDRLLSLTLTDLCLSLESRENFRQAIFEIAAFGNPLLNRLCTGALFTKEELEAQMMFLKLRRKVKECYEQQQSPNWGDVQMFVAQELMPRLLFLPLEGLVCLLDDLRFYDLLVKVVTTKAAQLSCRKSRRFTPGRRPKWPSLSAESTDRKADVHMTLVASCYRHVGDCLSRYCKEFFEDPRPVPAEHQQQQDNHTSPPDPQQESKLRAAALVNACLASDDESLRNYVLDWITAHGGANFPVSLLRMDGPTADRFLSKYHSAFAIDLGERYAASGLYAQAAKCHNLQGLQQWSSDPQVNLSGEPPQPDAQKQEQQQEASTSATSADVTSVLAYDETGDGFCCSLTKPVWHLLSCWLAQNAQKPSLDDRLVHFSKAKESVQLCMQRAASSRGGNLNSVDRMPENRLSKMAVNSWQEEPTERSLQQIDLNIKMVGIQRALLRDAARVFCVLSVNAIYSFRKERALSSGLPSPPLLPVTPDDLETFCRDILAGTADANAQTSGPSDFSSPILSFMLDLQREVYAPHELMDLMTMRIKYPRVGDLLTPHFPSIAALRLYGQRALLSSAPNSAQSGNAKDAQNALDEACMSFLSFAETACNVLQQPRILSEALRDLLALPDVAVKECCRRSLKRLSVILHIHAQAHWGSREVTMTNAEGEPVMIPGFLWPAWRLAECEVPFDSIVALYLSYEQDAAAKQQSGLQLGEMRTIFCWIFEQWLTSQDDVGSANTYVGLLHRLTEAGDLPYFGPAVGVLLRSQLTERERAQADAAAQQLTEVLLEIEFAMTSATQMINSLERDRHFIGVRSRLAILKQQVMEYRAALHDRQDLAGF
ncbi:hypothetical protein Emed_004778 [Eimeria media]